MTPANVDVLIDEEFCSTDVQQAVCCGIDGGVQPESVVIQLAHSLVNRDVIRICAIKRLSICLLHPVVTGRSTAFDTQPLENRDGLRKG